MKYLSMNLQRKLIAGLLITGTLIVHPFAQVTSQWRGPQRDGVYDGTNLLESWPKQGPKLLFTLKGLGTGHSSPAVTTDRIYVSGMVKETGYISAFDISGKKLWKISYGPEWNGSYPGVRATPTVEGDRLYLISGKGLLICLSTTDGKKIWTKDLMKDFDGQKTSWGFSESVLIDGDRLFCAPGGKKVGVAALDKSTGKVLWSTAAEGEKSGYCSPIIVQHGGKKLLVTMLQKSIFAFDATSGKQLWKYDHPTSYGVNANSPIYTDGSLICFSGYKQGAVKLKLSDDGSSVTKEWSNPKFDIQIGGAVLMNGVLYGSSHKKPAWHALDITNGTIIYSTTAIKRGCCIAAGGLLYCYSEKGEFALMKPGKDKFSIISTFKVKEGKGIHWAHPVITNGCLFIRHDDVLCVYSIRK